MITQKNKRSAGNRIYSVVGWFCYIACTIISAILNIYLLSKLDQSWAWFLLTMSLALEFGKAYILIRANTYKSLSEYLKNCKFNSSKVNKKEATFYGIYVLFALLSITASLCFSLTITDKTEQGFLLKKQEISQNIETLEKSILERDNAKQEFEFIKNNKTENLNNVKEAYWKAEDNLSFTDKTTDMLANEIASKKGITLNEAYRTAEYKTSKEKADFDKAKIEMKRAKDRLSSAENGEDLKLAEENYNLAKAEVEENINAFGTLNSMKLSLNSLKEQEREMAGSSKCFILLAETFGIPDKVKQIKFFILLFVSLLVELCIWLSSPDLRLDGSLLYSFRNDIGLSNKKDVDKLLKEIKETNTRFSFKEDKKPEIKIIEKTPQKTLKELDNLKEQVELLTRENEELLDKTLENPEEIVEREELKAEVFELSEYNSEIEKEIANKDKVLEENKNKILELESKINEEIAEKENMLKSNDEKIKTLKNKVANLSSDKDKVLEENKNKILELESKIKDLEGTKEILNKELEEIKNDNSKNEEIKKLEDKIEKIKKLSKEEIEKYKKQIEELPKDKKYSEDDLKEAIKKTVKKSSEEMENLRNAVSNWKKEYSRLNTENSNLLLTNKSLERKLNFKEQSDVVNSAEDELKDMIDNL